MCNEGRGVLDAEGGNQLVGRLVNKYSMNEETVEANPLSYDHP